MKLAELNDMIAGICPIHGINSNGEICFMDEATDTQKQTARDIMDANLSLLGTDSAGDILRKQIADLERSITDRMVQEAISGSTLTGLGADKSMTAKQYIAHVRAQIEALRT